MGQFKVRIMPPCGMDVAGCSVELLASYIHLDSQELFFEILPDEIVGLTDEQVDELSYEIQTRKSDDAIALEVIDSVQEFLGRVNPSSVKVIKAQVADEQKKEEQMRQA